MNISVIIPAYNEEKLLPATLRAVKAAMRVFERYGWGTELIVCDNNSTDRTGELAGLAGAHVVFEPINQISRARNRGAAAATGDWLLFIDADSSPTAELFEDVAQAIRSGHWLAGGSTVRMIGESRWAHRLCRFWNWLSLRHGLLAGSFIFCEATAFRTVGGFSEELFAAEEIDLSRKLGKLAAKQGKQIAILQRHPLLTSDRKVHLYSRWEHLGFIVRTVLGLGRSLRSREACFQWYDGRR